jgi:hypothetical protein
MGILKKVFRAVTRPVKKIIDPVLDLGAGIVKAVISPFTGAFDIPDVSIDTNIGNNEITANTTVNFNGANRAIPVIYGTQVDTAVIPVFVGTEGQYLYMAGVIGQGMTMGANYLKSVDQPLFNSEPDTYMGAKIVRMTIDGKPVHLAHDQGSSIYQYGNPWYSEGTDSSNLISERAGDSIFLHNSGVYASGFNNQQPDIVNIERGTFANRLSIQYFDGSDDQPASSLLQEHPDWTTNHRLQGISYVALRFKLQAADETVNFPELGSSTSGNGTYGNPYNGIPSVVVTVPGRSTPNIIAGAGADPGYIERLQTNWGDPKYAITAVFQHKRLDYPDGQGDWQTKDHGTISAAKTVVLPVASDTTIQLQRNMLFQPKTDSNGNTQSVQLHDILFEQFGTGYEYIWFYPGAVTGDSTGSTYGGASDPQDDMILFKHVGGGHYRFHSPMTTDKTLIISTAELTFFGYTSPHVGDYRQAMETAGVFDSASNIPMLRIYGENSELFGTNATGGGIQAIQNDFDDSDPLYDDNPRITIRDIESNYTQTYFIKGLANKDSTNLSIDVALERTDSVVETNLEFYRSIPDNALIYHERSANTGGESGRTLSPQNYNKNPASYDIALANGYQHNGLPHQSYVPDKNPVEFILDFMLNDRYGLGIPTAQIDRNSFLQAAIKCDTLAQYSSSVAFFILSHGSRAIEYGEEGDSAGQDTRDQVYMYGENTATDYDNDMVTSSVIDSNFNGYDRQFIIDTSQNQLENLNKMLSSIGAYMPFYDNKFHIFLEDGGQKNTLLHTSPLTALPIQLVIDEDNVIGSAVLKSQPINNRLNSIKVDYTEAERNATVGTKLIPDPITDSAGSAVRETYLTEDNNKVLENTFTLPSIFDKHTAARYGRILLKKSRGQPTILTTVTAQGLNLVPGDLVRVNLSKLKVNDVYRVTEVTINYDNTVALDLIKHDPDIYESFDDEDTLLPRKDIMT